MESTPRNLAECRSELQGLIAEAVGEMTRQGKWDRASRFIAVGRRLEELLSAGTMTATQEFAPKTSAEPAPVGGALSKNSSPVVKAQRGTLAKLDTRVYPQFFREGTVLVKVGWSKSGKNEYEHKSPRAAVDALVAACARAGTAGARFTMEKLLPLRGPTGEELPEYQAYVALAWLRHVGLLIQHGRSGYSIAKGISLSAATESAWAELAAR